MSLTTNYRQLRDNAPVPEQIVAYCHKQGKPVPRKDKLAAQKRKEERRQRFIAALKAGTLATPRDRSYRAPAKARRIWPGD